MVLDLFVPLYTTDANLFYFVLEAVLYNSFALHYRGQVCSACEVLMASIGGLPVACPQLPLQPLETGVHE